MARNVSDEELQLKKRARRRLVGAIVLVTAVAVVLPMILDSEPKPASQSINIQIPSPDAGMLTAAPTPLKPADSATPAAKPEAKPEPVKPETVEARPSPVEGKSLAAAPARSEAKPEAKAESRPESGPEAKSEAKAEAKSEAKAEPVKPAAKPEKADKAAPAKAEARSKETVNEKAKDKAGKDKAKAPSGAFVVQVAALSDAAKARELQAKIAGGGLKAYTEVVQTAKGPVTRVRVGPYATREAAEKGRQQLQRLQLDGKVVPR